MSVLIEAVTVVVRSKALRATSKRRSPHQHLIEMVPLHRRYTDRTLWALRFPNLASAQEAAREIHAQIRESDTDGVAIIDQHEGAIQQPRWCRTGELTQDDGNVVLASWLAGFTPGRLATPKGWKYSSSLSARTSSDETRTQCRDGLNQGSPTPRVVRRSTPSRGYPTNNLHSEVEEGLEEIANLGFVFATDSID